MKSAIMFITAAVIFLFFGCNREPKESQEEEEASPYLMPGREATPVPKLPSKDDTTAALIEYLRGSTADGHAWARAMAIDILAERKSEEAIPHLIECLSDRRGLRGSDNWVGGHAANALSGITGRPFDLDQDRWRDWWKQKGETRLPRS